jgi:hypothetical protein
MSALCQSGHPALQAIRRLFSNGKVIVEYSGRPSRPASRIAIKQMLFAGVAIFCAASLQKTCPRIARFSTCAGGAINEWARDLNLCLGAANQTKREQARPPPHTCSRNG